MKVTDREINVVSLLAQSIVVGTKYRCWHKNVLSKSRSAGLEETCGLSFYLTLLLQLGQRFAFDRDMNSNNSSESMKRPPSRMMSG